MREGLEATPDLVARQRDEARLLGLLAHDSIVQVIDLTEVSGRPAVVMEYVEGIDLSELLRSRSNLPLPVRASLEIIQSAAAALEAAYNTRSPETGEPLRVIHRDIKPANLLITTYGRVKVLDFGIAKADFWREGHTTQGGYGTPRFMSPEQWLGDTCGSPLDVYALGVTFYELLAGRQWERPPLARRAFEAHVSRILGEVADVPQETLAVIAAMTAFDPADRPTTAQVCESIDAELLAALGDSLARLARAAVPPLLEARARAHAAEPLPAAITLAGISTSEEPNLSMAPLPLAIGVSAAPDISPRGLIAGLAAALLVIVALVGVGSLVIAGLFIGAPSWDDSPSPAEPVVDAPVAPEANPVEPPAAIEAASEPATSEPTTPEEPDRALGATGKPRTGPRPAAGPATAPSNGPQAAVARATGAAVTPAPTYRLSVTTDPMSAAVFIDGRPIGKSPSATAELPAGRYTVTVALGDRSAETEVVLGTPESPDKIRYYFETNAWKTLK